MLTRRETCGTFTGTSLSCFCLASFSRNHYKRVVTDYPKNIEGLL